jgi:filamentous hemagglutinin family protein
MKFLTSNFLTHPHTQIENLIMTTKFWLCFLTLTSLVVSTQTALAQTYQPSDRTPVADNTLGTQVSGSGNNFNITGGLNRGKTLFHSFTDFSVPTNGQANFTNPVGSRDIITRVTGTVFSDINGLVNTNGANFFLINPNGIVFGTNAQLNVGKAFVGSTANSLDLVDGSGRTITFGTNANGDAPLLSVAPNVLFDVSGLNINGGNSQISNFGKLQTTTPSQYIGLIGGNVALDGGRIYTVGGRIELGGLSAPGSVVLGVEGDIPKLKFPTNVTRADVSLTNQSKVNPAGFGGGDIVITARNLEILGGSGLVAGIESGFGTPATVAGDINLNVAGAIFVDASGIGNVVKENAIGTGGNIIIDTGLLSLTNGSVVGALTVAFGQGNAGNVMVTAKDAISLADKSFIVSGVEAGGVGNGGNIQIDTGSLVLSNNSRLATETAVQGNAGNVTISAKDTVSLTNVSGISSVVQTGAVGNGGNIQIDTGSLSLSSGSIVGTPTYGQGNGGNLIVTAKDAVSLTDGAAIASTVQPGGVGKGGNIDIKAGSLSLRDGAQLQTATLGASTTQPAGRGDAGNVNVKVAGTIEIVGAKDDRASGVIGSTDVGTEGNGGNIALDASSISFREGAGLLSDTAGTGNAGNITVTSKAAVIFDSTAGIVSRVLPDGVGNGGNITVSGGTISFRDGAGLNSETLGQGDAGTITVNARESVSLSGESNVSRSFLVYRGGFFVNSQSDIGSAGDIVVISPKITLDNNAGITAQSVFGRGGNITIGSTPATDLLLLRRGSKIATDAGGTAQQGGNGGNITINSKLIVAIPTENSDITANAVKGRGGNVNIDAQGLFGIQFRPQTTRNSDITASSDFGQNGNVNISTPGTDPGKDSTELPNVTTDASKQISQVCSTNNRQNKLTVTGRGGLPPNANDPLTSDVVWQDARAASSQPVVSSAPTPVKLAPPAVGWVFDGKGKVTLIAAGTQGQPTGTQVVCPKEVK